MINLNLPPNVKVEEEQDILGGNRILPSGLYAGIAELIYLTANDKGTQSIVVHFKYKNKVYKLPTYISTQSTDKEDLSKVRYTYVDKKTKKDRPLPGYASMDSMFKILNGKSLSEQTLETKKIKLYNWDQRKEVPTDVQVFTELLNTPMTVGILEKHEEKTTPESRYQDGTGEYREFNTFDKFFDSETNQTLPEKIAGKDATFLLKWKDSNDGKVRKKAAPNPGAAASGNTGTAGIPGAGAASVDDVDPFADDD